MLEFMKQLAKAMKDTNTSDLTEPSKFSSADHNWDEWHYQLRSYLEAKGWPQTYDHPTGPGTPGFDTEINKKLYNKLTMLCAKGTAITYLRKAAEFDGWGAGKQLKLRYHGFSKQRGKTLRNTVESLRHVHGTNITKHIDLFEKLITQMSHNDPLHPPTEEQRIDWFLDSVTERTYDSVQATCSEGNIEGTLIFNKMVKLFTHKFFQRYPEFQIKELVDPSTKTTVTNNSTTTYDRRGRNKGGKGKGRGNPSKGNHHHGHKGHRTNKGKGTGKGDKGRPKGKGKTNRPTLGNPITDTCSYCQKPGHQNRECRKRLYDEKKKTQTNNGQHVTHLQVDETELMFSQNVVHVTPYSDEEDIDEEWVGDDDAEYSYDSEEDDNTEDHYGTEWQHNMQPTLLAICSLPPGHLKPQHAGPSQPYPPTEPTQSHLLVAKLQPPAAKKTSPRGHPTTQVGHYPHPSMELPPLGGETEDPTSLPLGPPSGSTNKLPQLSSPNNQNKHESSSVNTTGQDYTQQWGTGKFSPSWGNYTVTPPEPWDYQQDHTSTHDTDQESEEAPTYLHRECSLCSTPLATFHAFEPLTCFECIKDLQTKNDNQIKTALTHAEREDEEEFQFKGIPIAGENDGDSEESWERESWDTGDDKETEKDSFTNILQWANWDTSQEHK
jgi:hypothetical protein